MKAAHSYGRARSVVFSPANAPRSSKTENFLRWAQATFFNGAAMRIPDTTGPRPRNRRPESSTSIAPCIRWPPWSRGHLLAVVYGEIERPAPYLRNGLWLSVVRRDARRVGRASTSSGAPPFRVASDQGAGPFQVVDTERNLGMRAHGA